MTDDIEAQFAAWKEQEKEGSKPPEAAPPEPAAQTPEPQTPEPEATETEKEELFPGYSTLSDESRQAVDALIQSERTRAAQLEIQFKALHGKVAPLQRELANLKKQPAQAGAVPKEPIAAVKPASDAKPKQWDRFRNELPDDAAAFEELVEGRIQERLQELEPLKAKAALLEKIEERERIAAEAAQLDQEFPNWGQTIDSDDFQDWVAALRETNQARYQSVVTALEGKSAAEHSKMLREFSLDLREIQLYEREHASAPKPAPVKKPEPDPSPRSSGPTTTGQRFKTPEEEAFARWKAANPD